MGNLIIHRFDGKCSELIIPSIEAFPLAQQTYPPFMWSKKHTSLFLFDAINVLRFSLSKTHSGTG